MSCSFNFVGSKNVELIARLVDLVRRGNELTAELLAHVAELEARMIHLELGYPSAFAYCVEELGFSEGAAGRRLTAARLCRRFPDAFELVSRGELHLSALCALAPHLKTDNANDLLRVCRRKTRRQVDELIAVRFPRPDVREQIRRLPVRSQQVGASAEDSELARAAFAASTPSPTPAVGLAPPPIAPSSSAPRRSDFEALAAERFGVHFTADAELRGLIERARALASHRLPQRDLAGLMKLVFKTFVEQEEKRRFAVGSLPRSRKARHDGDPGGLAKRHATRDAKGAAPRDAKGLHVQARGGACRYDVILRSTAPGEAPARMVDRQSAAGLGRYVPAAVRREVFARDAGCCAFVAKDGRRCGAGAFLELDHVLPWAAGGETVPSNLRLLCRAHNALHARKCFGAEHVAVQLALRRAETRQGRAEK